MNRTERDRFDGLLERVLDAAPPEVRRAIERVPVIVLDRPTPELLDELGLGDDPDAGDELCGLHTGVSEIEASVEDSGSLPSDIHLFREGIVATAGGWGGGDGPVAEEIRITLLHELGHQFGLDEDDLADLGYD